MSEPNQRPAIPPDLISFNVGVRIAAKAVPGAGREAVAGPLCGRPKVQVAVPPEDGKANEAICKLLAKVTGLPARLLQIDSSHTRPENRSLPKGATLEIAAATLGVAGK